MERCRMVKKKPEPKGKMKAAQKSFKSDAMKQQDKKAKLVQRTNYEKGNEMKKTVQRKADKPFGSSIGKK